MWCAVVEMGWVVDVLFVMKMWAGLLYLKCVVLLKVVILLKVKYVAL